MSWHEVLRCPRCRGLVESEPIGGAGALRCSACARIFPAVGGMVVLLREPERTLSEWRYRLDDYVRHNEDTRARILAELASEAKLTSTRARLEALHRHLGLHQERLVALFAAAGLVRERRAAEPIAPPSETSVTAHYHQIHRDWGWEQDGNHEAREAADALAAVIAPGAALGRVLVLGAGAARLSRDVHVRFGASLTVALDLNPLPFLVARRLFAGEALRLYEFPTRPRLCETPCVDRLLSAEPIAGVELVFADGLDPPVADGSFDTVLTPWFIDQVPADAATLCAPIHRVLAPGGRWLNFGPLVYDHGRTRLVHRYCPEELLELVTSEGFSVERHTLARMRYLESPAGTQGRTELVLTFAALRAERPDRARESEAWLDDADAPVPKLGLDGYAAPHPMFAAIAALIDGARTTRDIARAMVERHGLPADAALAGVQAALSEIARRSRH